MIQQREGREMANARQKNDDPPVEAASARVSGNDPDRADSSQVDQEVDPNKSTATLDKETRMEAEQSGTVRNFSNVYDRPDVTAPYAVEGNDTSAYVGVNPEYMTYANETERPYRAPSDSAEGYFEDQLLAPKKYAVGADSTSNQTEGGGSSVPLLYPEVSGEGYVNEPVKVTDSPTGDDVVDDSAPTQTKDGATPVVKAPAEEF